MTHAEVHERLAELVGVRSANDGDAQLRAHVVDCHRCAARLRSLERVERLLQSTRGHESEGPPTALEQRVVAIPALYSRAQTRRPRRLAAATVGAVIAAAAAAVAVLALALARPSAHAPSAFQPERVVALKARGRSVEAKLTLGHPSGSTQPLRLVAEGFSPGPPRLYALWLVGPNGSVMLRSFRPNDEGSCVVDAAAPAGKWTQVVITSAGSSPASERTIASAKL